MNRGSLVDNGKAGCRDVELMMQIKPAKTLTAWRALCVLASATRDMMAPGATVSIVTAISLALKAETSRITIENSAPAGF